MSGELMADKALTPETDDPAVEVDGQTFRLHGASCTYSFYVSDDGDLIHSHFGGPSHSEPPPVPRNWDGGWTYGPPTSAGRAQRELPDLGNGDFRQPAIRVRHGDGTAVTSFKYADYRIKEGKGGIPGMPATFGDASVSTTLLVRLVDNIAQLECTLSYAVFPACNAIVRSMSVINKGSKEAVIEVAASFSVDLAPADRQMIGLSGDWGREGNLFRRGIYPGQQG